MKKNRVVFLIALVLALITETMAQDLIIRGGLNISKMLDRDSDYTYSDDYDNLYGIYLGLGMEKEIDAVTAFEIGLLLSQKGFSMEMEEMVEGELLKMTAKVKALYVDIPLHFKSKVAISEGVNFYGLYGLYLAVGVGGKIEVEGTYAGQSTDESIDISWGTDDNSDDFIPFDAGLSLGGGFEFGDFLLGLQYNFGLINISPYTDGGYKNKNRVFSISLAYRFTTQKTKTEATPK